MTGEKELLKSIDRRLKMLVSLGAMERTQGLDTNKEKVRELHRIGFDTAEMAELIDTTPASVRAAKSNLRDAGEIDG